MNVLDGIRVVDASQYMAGPFCAQILGDLGADVVKVERPGGDLARTWGPPFRDDGATIFLAANRNKRSIVLDLKAEAGREVVRRLMDGADVFIQSFRPGVPERLGLGVEEARRSNPRLVYCSLTAFGPKGPLRHQPGYDPLLQAYGGLMSLTGYPDEPPARVGTSIMDMGTGMWTALAVMAALRKRDETGEGSHVETSLFDTALMWTSYQLMGYLATGEVPTRMGTGLGMIVPYQAFPASDGHLMIAAGTDRMFSAACDAMEIPETAGDPRFRTNEGRVRHRAELVSLLSKASRTFTRAELGARLEAAGVPYAPIQTIDQVAASDQTAANGMLIREADDPRGDHRAVALPARWDGQRAEFRRPAPRMGQHTREILGELGYDADAAAALIADGIAEGE